MTTRCDFYFGRGSTAQYLGSIGHDAFIDTLAEYFEAVSTREVFLERLQHVFKVYGEISAQQGWPWPWRDSSTTDTVIAFDVNDVWTPHESGCWARLAQPEKATAQRCVFPDMLAEDERTAAGRLRLALRGSAGLTMRPGADVLWEVLCAATRRLAPLWLHVRAIQGEFWVLANLWEACASRHELEPLWRTLRRCEDDLRPLLDQRLSAEPGLPWGLLHWLLESRGVLTTCQTETTLDAALPGHFGQPIPDMANVNRNLRYRYLRVIDRAAFEQLLAWVEQLFDHEPGCFAVILTKEMVAYGALPRQPEALATWLTTPLPSMPGQTPWILAHSHTGRQTLKALAAAQVFQPH